MREFASIFVLFFLTTVSTTQAQRSPAIDFDGDGLTDRYWFQGTTIVVALGAGGSGTTPLSSDYNTSLGVWREGDFNGDGKTDLAHIVFNGVNDPNYVHVHFSGGNGRFISPTYFNFRLEANPQQDYKTSIGYWRAEDYDGDRKTDLIHETGRIRIHRWKSLGNGRFEIHDWPEVSGPTTPPQQRRSTPAWTADCLCKRGSAWVGHFVRNPIGAAPSVGDVVVLGSSGQVCYPSACDDGTSVTNGSKRVKVRRVFITSQGSQVYTFSIFGEEVP